jgi:predicted Zn-ribbon and HTH transcriptional regulator
MTKNRSTTTRRGKTKPAEKTGKRYLRNIIRSVERAGILEPGWREKMKQRLKPPACEVCGRPAKRPLKYDVCTRTPRCKRKWHKKHNEFRVMLRIMRGSLSRLRMRGMNHPGWSGGEFKMCSGCGREAGWRFPYQIAKNKSGRFYCAQCRGAPKKPGGPVAGGTDGAEV